MRARALGRIHRGVVVLTLDKQSRIVEVPEDLAAALAGTEGVRERFNAMPFSHQRESRRLDP